MQTREYTEIRKEIINLNLDFAKARVRIVTKGDNYQYLSYAVEGFMKAIDDYDFSKNCELLAYAQKRIDRYIMNGMQAELNDKKISPNFLSEMKRINKSSDNPTVEEIAKQLGVKKQTVYYILHALENPIRFDYVNGDDKDLQNHELIPDGRELFTRALDREAVCERLNQLIEEALTDEQKVVIKLKMGFGCKPLTFIEIGKKLGITHQGAQHRYNVALKRLREYTAKKYSDINIGCLEPFVEEIPEAHAKKAS